VKGATSNPTFWGKGASHRLEAVLPYLCCGKDLFDPPLDLATPEGRREQAVRLAVADQLLPQDESKDRKLHKIMLLLPESDRKPAVRYPQASLLAHNRRQAARQPAQRISTADLPSPAPHPWVAVPNHAGSLLALGLPVG
jgi:hypothetical protein